MNNIVFKQVLNSKFSSSMLFRCTKREFAEDIKKGKFYFNIPEKWIEQEKEGNKGQGDMLEGTFLSVLKNDDSIFVENMKSDARIENFEYGDFIYFRKKDIKKMFCLCFYGVNDYSFDKEVDEFGRAKYITKVTKEYFSDFSAGIKEENYGSIDVRDQPVVVFIRNPRMLFQKIKDFFTDKGVSEEEIIISPVEYLDKRTSAIANVPYPMELLLKDKDFSNQSEVRVILNSENEIIKRYMEQNGNIIDIGDIAEIVDIYDYYFEDLHFEKTDNTIVFNSSTETFVSFDELNLRDLVDSYVRVLRMDDAQFGENDRGDVKMQLEKLVEEKYKISMTYDEGTVHLQGVDELLYAEIDSWQEPKRTIDNFVRCVENLIENNEKNQAIEKIKMIDKGDVCYPYTYYLNGIILKIDGYFKEAAEQFSYCINKNVNKIESLQYRSYCYSMLNLYQLAINDMDRLQDIIGYDEKIYIKRGIDLLYLNKKIEAVEEFSKALELSPNDGYALWNRGVAYYRMGEMRLAESDMRKALECEPKNATWSAEYKTFFVKD